MATRLFYVRTTVLTVALCLGAQACVSGGDHESGEESAQAAPVTVVVDNRAWADMRIFVVRGGSAERIRLGMVGSMRRARFRVPSDLYAVRGIIEIISVPIGGEDTHRSGTLLVGPGTVITFLLNNRPSLSQVRLRS